MRLQAHRHGAGLAVSEMVSSFAIATATARTLEEMLRIHPDERPVSIQLFGPDPEVMREAAAVAAAAGADADRPQHGLPGAEGAARPAPARRCSTIPSARSRSRARAIEGSGPAGHRQAALGAASPATARASTSRERLVEEAGVAAIALPPARRRSSTTRASPTTRSSRELRERSTCERAR